VKLGPRAKFKLVGWENRLAYAMISQGGSLSKNHSPTRGI